MYVFSLVLSCKIMGKLLRALSLQYWQVDYTFQAKKSKKKTAEKNTGLTEKKKKEKKKKTIMSTVWNSEIKTTESSLPPNLLNPIYLHLFIPLTQNFG